MKVAYVTDLHLLAKDTSSIKRASNLASKLSRARQEIAALLLGGDSFIFTKNFWPDAMLKGPATKEQIKEMRLSNIASIDEFMPKILSAIPGLPVFTIPGNADWLSYDHIRENASKYKNVFPIDGGAVELNGFRFIGLGGIEANDKDTDFISLNNGWYGGVLSPNAFTKKIGLLESAVASWGKDAWQFAVLMVHQPPLGLVDVYKGAHAGGKLVAEYLKVRSPLLALAGHVHDAPVDAEGYKFNKAFDVTANRTVVANTGGGPHHDEILRGAVIDLGKLYSDPSNLTAAVSEL